MTAPPPPLFKLQRARGHHRGLVPPSNTCSLWGRNAIQVSQAITGASQGPCEPEARVSWSRNGDAGPPVRALGGLTARPNAHPDLVFHRRSGVDRLPGSGAVSRAGGFSHWWASVYQAFLGTRWGARPWPCGGNLTRPRTAARSLCKTCLCVQLPAPGFPWH